MDKVIVERPRHGSRMNNDDKGQRKLLQRARVNEDLLPGRASSARGRRNDFKHLNEHLGPMRRYLNARVGRHWNKVYAEVRQRINPDSAQQMHILQHMVGSFGYVQTDVKAWSDGSFTDLRGLPLHCGWFVDPKTGCLRRNETSYVHGWRLNRRRADEVISPYVRRDGQHFREIDGVWYEVNLRPVELPSPLRRFSPRPSWYPNARPDPQVYDVILRGSPTFGEMWSAHGDYVYAVAKRQLGSREIRRYGLRPEVLVLPESPHRR